MIHIQILLDYINIQTTNMQYLGFLLTYFLAYKLQLLILVPQLCLTNMFPPYTNHACESIGVFNHIHGIACGTQYVLFDVLRTGVVH